MGDDTARTVTADYFVRRYPAPASEGRMRTWGPVSFGYGTLYVKPLDLSLPFRRWWLKASVHARFVMGTFSGFFIMYLFGVVLQIAINHPHDPERSALHSALHSAKTLVGWSGGRLADFVNTVTFRAYDARSNGWWPVRGRTIKQLTQHVLGGLTMHDTVMLAATTALAAMIT
jgi:hypothetical protein